MTHDDDLIRRGDALAACSEVHTTGKPHGPDGILAAIRALPAVPHVNETPKSEHDAGNVLTVPDLVEAAIAELQDVMRCRCDKAFTDRGMHDPDCQCDSQDALDTLIALATAQAAQIKGLRGLVEVVSASLHQRARDRDLTEGELDFMRRVDAALEARDD